MKQQTMLMTTGESSKCKVVYNQIYQGKMTPSNEWWLGKALKTRHLVKLAQKKINTSASKLILRCSVPNVIKIASTRDIFSDTMQTIVYFDTNSSKFSFFQIAHKEDLHFQNSKSKLCRSFNYGFTFFSCTKNYKP